jgi:hypothetical protein
MVNISIANPFSLFFIESDLDTDRLGHNDDLHCDDEQQHPPLQYTSDGGPLGDWERHTRVGVFK